MINRNLTKLHQCNWLWCLYKVTIILYCEYFSSHISSFYLENPFNQVAIGFYKCINEVVISFFELQFNHQFFALCSVIEIDHGFKLNEKDNTNHSIYCCK